MKTEKEIKEYLIKTELAYKDAVKCKKKYLQTVGSSVINALRWVLNTDLPVAMVKATDMFRIIRLQAVNILRGENERTSTY